MVQWEKTFRQPSYGDHSSAPFTGPEFADCSDPDVPDTHCCRARTAFWVSNKPDHDRYYNKELDENGNIDVTGCRKVCGENFLRLGEDTQCVPVLPECNDWAGGDSPEFTVSDLVLLEAYCLCGMKRSVVPASASRRRADDNDPYLWANAFRGSIDSVSGGHFEASDQCYESSVNFHTRVFAEMDRTCPTASGENMLYTEMSITDIIFNRAATTSAYPDCASADGLDCCEVSRTDAMSTHYYPLKASDDFVENNNDPSTHPFSRSSAWVSFGTGMPFGTSPSTSPLVFTYDFDMDGTDDVVVGNRLYLSRSPDGVSVQRWETSRHVGKRFTSGTPVAIDATTAEGIGKAFVAIAYDDNSIVLYSYDYVAGQHAKVVLRWERTLDIGDRGDVSALYMYHATTQTYESGLDSRERIGVYAAYTDAEDLIHVVSYPKPVHGTTTSHVPTYDTHLPVHITAARAVIPSLCVAASLFWTDYAYPETMQATVTQSQSKHVLDIFFVGTPVNNENLIVIDRDGYAERGITGTTQYTSVAVATYAFVLESASGTQEAVGTRILVCFANTNTRNVCYRFSDAGEDFPGNSRMPHFSPVSTESYEFGNSDENTADIAVLDLNKDGFVDLVTIEAGGYVRVYRGNYYTQNSADFSSSVPEPLDPSSYSGTRRAMQQSLNPAGINGRERFMSHSKLAIGKCGRCYSPPPPPPSPPGGPPPSPLPLPPPPPPSPPPSPPPNLSPPPPPNREFYVLKTEQRGWFHAMRQCMLPNQIDAHDNVRVDPGVPGVWHGDKDAFESAALAVSEAIVVDGLQDSAWVALNDVCNEGYFDAAGGRVDTTFTNTDTFVPNLYLGATQESISDTPYFTRVATHTPWAANEPNQRGNEDCVHWHPSGLNDLRCDNTGVKLVLCMTIDKYANEQHQATYTTEQFMPDEQWVNTNPDAVASYYSNYMTSSFVPGSTLLRRDLSAGYTEDTVYKNSWWYTDVGTVGQVPYDIETYNADVICGNLYRFIGSRQTTGATHSGSGRRRLQLNDGNATLRAHTDAIATWNRIIASANDTLRHPPQPRRLQTTHGMVLVRDERDEVPVTFIIAHHYSPDTNGGSCSMRCHEAGRMGYDSFKLYKSTGITAVDGYDLDAYYRMGEPTECLCGPKYDSITAPVCNTPSSNQHPDPHALYTHQKVQLS
jgi:hypothetical protein